MSSSLTETDELLAAIKTFDVEKVQSLVNKGINLEAILDTERNSTALLIAGRNHIPLSDDEERESALNSPESREKAILRERMIFESRKAIIRILLDAGANIDHQDCAGHTILNICITKGHPTLPPMLVERGANINLYKPERMFPPLINAILQGQCDLALLLIERGADVNHKARDYRREGQKTALMEVFDILSYKDDEGIKVLEALLNAKANPNDTNDLGQNILFDALDKGFEVRDRTIALLLNHGANVQQRDNAGNTPIARAFKSNKKAFRLMIKMITKDDLSLPCNANKETLFEVVARRGDVEHLQYLYNLVEDKKLMKELMQNTFSKVGTVSRGFFCKHVFGHSKDEYDLEKEEKDDILHTVKWFLKYLDSDFIQADLQRREGLLKTRRAFLKLAGNAENSDNDTIPLTIMEESNILGYVENLIVGTLAQELILRQELTSRKEIVLNNDTTPEALLSAHQAHSKSLRALVKTVSAEMDTSHKDLVSKMTSTNNHQQKIGFELYWIFAERNKKDSNFPFCRLATPLKANIMSFLESPPPYRVSMLPAYFNLMQRRLTWAQSIVNVPYGDRKQRQDEARKKAQQSITRS